MDDQRFAHVGRDPKFRSMPKKDKKVKIDKRFDAMFKDKQFKLKYTVDKRGRPVNFSSSEDLKRYYEADEGSEDEDEDEEEADEADEGEAAGTSSLPDAAGDGATSDDGEDDEPARGASTSPLKTKAATPDTKQSKKAKKVSAKKSKAAETEIAAEKQSVKKLKKDMKKKKERKSAAQLEEEEQEDVEVGEDVRERLMDLAVDYARGGGVLMEDSSSDDESEPEEVAVEHDWAEMDREAPRIPDDETTTRLALCNMDWDRIKAQDIMVLMSSFLPPGGVIKDVAIYPSEFGKQRLAEEEERGPPELFDAKQKDDADSSDDEDEPKDDTETAELSQMEYVRRYQLSRLRYYYAVISCDSRQTAAKLYDECEGLEFESSASRVDLRFIPDDMTFEETPRERCSTVPEAGRYRPSQFVTTALQQRQVRFTWDETDADRQEVVRRAVTKGDVDDADIRAYLADSSDEQQSDEDGGSGEEDEVDGKEDEQTRIAKYRALLADDDDQEEDKQSDGVEMEITWGGMDLKEKAEELVKKKEQEKDLTPWEKYIEKQKTKKRAKSAAQKEAANAASSGDSDSDSDIPSDLADDPFFKEELDARRAEGNKQKKKKKAGKGRKDEAEDADEGDQDQLALLTMDDGEEDNRRHFNFKQIVKDETTSGKKRKWKKKRKPTEEKAPADDFEVNVADPRFSKLYESAAFNVDPSDARFKATAGMQRLVGEKQRRVATGEVSRTAQEDPASKKARLAPSAAPAVADDLGALVSTIKSKTKQLKKKKAKSS